MQTRKVSKARSMSFSIKPELYNQINSFCSEQGCTRSWFITQAINQYLLESLEDKRDYEDAVKAWHEYEKSGFKSYTAEEVHKELGL